MNRKLHATLALVAVLSFGLYILGCVGYAAWNADGSKLLIPYYSPQAKEWGVVLYDLKAHSSQKLMTQTGVDQGDTSMQVQWVNGASQPFIVVASKGRGRDDRKHLDAYLVPGNGAPICNWLLPNFGDLYLSGPFAELGGKVFIPTSSLAVVDLRGTTDVVNYDDNEEPIVSLATDGKRVYYVRGASRPAPTPENAGATEDGIEFGEVNLPDLKRIRYFELFNSELAAQGVELDGADLIVEQGGTRLAMLGKQGNASSFLIFNATRLERSLVPKLPASDCRVGGFTWPRSDMIYAVVGCPTADHIAQISAAEIDVNDGSVRLAPVVRVNATGSSFWDGFDDMLKPSLAPNGRMLAITTTVLDKSDVTQDNRALFLVDMKSPDRRVTRIAMPGMTQTTGR